MNWLTLTLVAAMVGFALAAMDAFSREWWIIGAGLCVLSILALFLLVLAVWAGPGETPDDERAAAAVILGDREGKDGAK